MLLEISFKELCEVFEKERKKRKSFCYYFLFVFLNKESRHNSAVEEDSEGDNDSEEFYYGGQVRMNISNKFKAKYLADFCAS